VRVRLVIAGLLAVSIAASGCSGHDSIGSDERADVLVCFQSDANDGAIQDFVQDLRRGQFGSAAVRSLVVTESERKVQFNWGDAPATSKVAMLNAIATATTVIAVHENATYCSSDSPAAS
jgi:hypothetical protein